MSLSPKKLAGKVQYTKSAKNKKAVEPKSKKLGELFATSICGNDISSSCLYVAGISIFYAGILAPVALLIIVLVLYLYKKVYSEVVTALPLNGGAYNCLLNTTSKFRASTAACMSILAYIATAVVSAMTAVYYFSSIVPSVKSFIIPGTILVLFTFAVLTIIGIGESAVVATVFFVFHLLTLTAFVLFGLFYIPGHLNIFQANLNTFDPHNLAVGLFFGFSAALLGISGFETSANFVEEQKPGVFVKTLRNMLITVSIFNPLISVIALGVLPIDAARANKDFVLSAAAGSMGIGWLKYLISIDAALVLSGAVLTSYVGVGGLIKRMTLDRCLPQFLLKTGKRKTNFIIIILFFLLCTSIILLTNGNTLTIAAVYTISFLGVMSLFALGNILLKIRRGKLKRKYVASGLTVVLALMSTVLGMVGNILLDPKNLLYFLIYFLPTIAIVGIMFVRIDVLKALLHMVKYVFEIVDKNEHKIARLIIHKIRKIKELKLIYFTRGDSRANLLEVMLYVRKNEQAKRIKFVHLYKDESEIPPKLKDDIRWIDEAFPDIKIDFEMIKGEFCPKTIEELSEKFGVAKNYMFIGTPGEHMKYTIEDFGEVRLII
ncbi:MAG: APC family permease [Deltaproteobacteria bacterium]